VDAIGAALCALGLAGITFGLFEQPLRGFGDAAVFLPLAVGAILFVSFLVYEERGTDHPILPLELFRRRNFTAGNIETFAMYGGLGMLFLSSSSSCNGSPVTTPWKRAPRASRLRW
jgi:hypothetical protein